MTPLTQLSPDELLFRDTVRDFARAEIAPFVRCRWVYYMPNSAIFGTPANLCIFPCGATLSSSSHNPRGHSYALRFQNGEPDILRAAKRNAMPISSTPGTIVHRPSMQSIQTSKNWIRATMIMS